MTFIDSLHVFLYVCFFRVKVDLDIVKKARVVDDVSSTALNIKNPVLQ